MKRAKKKVGRAKPEKMLPMYTTERATLLTRLTGALWEELQASLAAMQRELEAMVGGGETPIIAVAPAIANAVHQATGVRSRSMPLKL